MSIHCNFFQLIFPQVSTIWSPSLPDVFRQFCTAISSTCMSPKFSKDNDFNFQLNAIFAAQNAIFATQNAIFAPQKRIWQRDLIFSKNVEFSMNFGSWGLVLTLNSWVYMSCTVEKHYFHSKFSIEVVSLDFFTLVTKAC